MILNIFEQKILENYQKLIILHCFFFTQLDPMSEPPSSKLLRSASFSRSQPDLSQSLNGAGAIVGVGVGANSGIGNNGNGGAYGYNNGNNAYNSSSHSNPHYGSSSYAYPSPVPLVQYPVYPTQLQSRGAYLKQQQQGQQGQDDQNAGNQNVPSTSVQMLEILMRENSNLRAELANARMRIQTIHKVN
jgi:hypothetical protein